MMIRDMVMRDVMTRDMVLRGQTQSPPHHVPPYHVPPDHVPLFSPASYFGGMMGNKRYDCLSPPEWSVVSAPWL